jgi:flagellar P-ring protein precursor FlgI
MGRAEKGFLLFLWFLAGLLVADAVRAERIKDVTAVAGVRSNQLVGYGIVVGLDGSGDQTTQTPFTVQSMISMLSAMGVNLPPGQSLQLKNVAAVMVTASLPAFARTGQAIDVTISSIGNAKSLKGGTLILTPLKGADGQSYAMAQGNVVVSGAGGSAGGSKVTVNHLSVGRIANGATVEREVPMPLGTGEYVYLETQESDFMGVKLIADAINKEIPGTATAVDGRQIRLKAPVSADERVRFIGRVEEIEVAPTRSVAKVIVNSRTGSVVMNQTVSLKEFAVAHGSLSIAVSEDKAGSGGAVDIKQEGGGLLSVKSSAKLTDVVKALNAIGANPQDLVAILQAMKSAGALRAELEII